MQRINFYLLDKETPGFCEVFLTKRRPFFTHRSSKTMSETQQTPTPLAGTDSIEADNLKRRQMHLPSVVIRIGCKEKLARQGQL